MNDCYSALPQNGKGFNPATVQKNAPKFCNKTETTGCEALIIFTTKGFFELNNVWFLVFFICLAQKIKNYID